MTKFWVRVVCTVLFASCVFGCPNVGSADEVIDWKPYVPPSVLRVLPSSLPDFKNFKIKVKTPKELLYPWDLNLLIVSSEDNPAFLPGMFTRRPHDVVCVPPSVLAEYLGIEERSVPYVRYFSHGVEYAAGFKRGGTLTSSSRTLAIQINDDYFSVRQNGMHGHDFPFSTPSWLYGDVSLGLDASSSKFQYTRRLSKNWYVGAGILANSPNYLTVGNGRGGLLAGYAETSGQDVGLLYDTCSGLRVGLRWGRQVQRGNLFLSSRAITDTKLYGFIRSALSFAESEVDRLSDPNNVSVWFTSLEAEFGRQLDRAVQDVGSREQYRTQFNDWATHERESGFPTVALARDEARKQLSRIEGELNKVVKPYTFDVSSELQTTTLDLEYDVSRNTTVFADYQMGKLRGVGTFQNGSLGVRHRFDEHWDMDVSFHGSTYPKIGVGYHNKDLNIELVHWRNSFQMLDGAVGPSSVFQLNASLKF